MLGSSNAVIDHLLLKEQAVLEAQLTEAMVDEVKFLLICWLLFLPFYLYFKYLLLFFLVCFVSFISCVILEIRCLVNKWISTSARSTIIKLIMK